MTPVSMRSAAISRALKPRCRQTERRIDVVKRAEDGARRVDRPVRRAEALHPTALLINQNRRFRITDRFPNSRTSMDTLSASQCFA